MNVEPILSKITIYPVKSLDGVVLESAEISDGGCLLHDREFAMSDEEGNFIIGKSTPLVHTLRSTIDFDNHIISFRQQDESSWKHYHLQKEKAEIEAYLSDHFNTSVTFHQNTKGRFLDIPDISGATILSTASLESITEWYPVMDIEETRKRFRATLEIEGVPAFWEDHLFSQEGRGIEFKIGEVTLYGMSPRARCVVPTRHPETGEVIHAFPKTFARKRASALPEFSTLPTFGHHYFLTVNCYIPATETGKHLHTGDSLKIIGEKIFY